MHLTLILSPSSVTPCNGMYVAIVTKTVPSSAISLHGCDVGYITEAV